jgi:cytochrome bd-type quinol oxidase subunit 2
VAPLLERWRAFSTAVPRLVNELSATPGQLFYLPVLQALGASLATMALSVIVKAELWGPGLSDASVALLLAGAFIVTFPFLVLQARSNRRRLPEQRALLTALVTTGALLAIGGVTFLYTLCHAVGPHVPGR